MQPPDPHQNIIMLPWDPQILGVDLLLKLLELRLTRLRRPVQYIPHLRKEPVWLPELDLPRVDIPVHAGPQELFLHDDVVLQLFQLRVVPFTRVHFKLYMNQPHINSPSLL